MSEQRLCAECQTTTLQPWERGYFCQPCSEMLSTVQMPALQRIGMDLASKRDQEVYTAWDRDGFKVITKEEYEYWMRHTLPFGCTVFPPVTKGSME